MKYENRSEYIKFLKKPVWRHTHPLFELDFLPAQTVLATLRNALSENLIQIGVWESLPFNIFCILMVLRLASGS